MFNTKGFAIVILVFFLFFLLSPFSGRTAKSFLANALSLNIKIWLIPSTFRKNCSLCCYSRLVRYITRLMRGNQNPQHPKMHRNGQKLGNKLRLFIRHSFLIFFFSNLENFRACYIMGDWRGVQNEIKNVLMYFQKLFWQSFLFFIIKFVFLSKCTLKIRLIFMRRKCLLDIMS